MMINPLFQTNLWENHNNSQLEAIKEYCSDYLESGPLVETRNGVAPVNEITRDRVATLAGSITLVEGVEVQEFEWGSLSINNRIWAFVHRQLGSF